MKKMINSKRREPNTTTKFNVQSWWLVAIGAIVLIMQSVPSWSYDSFSNRLFNPRLSVASHGAGSLVGAQEDVNAVFGNPAFLTSLMGMKATIGSGLLPGNHVSTTFAFAQPIPIVGKLGLGLTSIAISDPEGDDPFQAHEQILILAYNYDLLPWMSVGARFREIRVEMPSLAKSGEGLDLGVKLSYQNYWLGMAGINLLQPDIDTQLEDIAYPRHAMVNLGGSWPGILRTMVEFSQTFGEEAINRIAWGIESDFSKQLTIRAGVDMKAVYAGLGTAINKLKLDYASRYEFEDQRIVHWLGVSAHFGAYEVGLTSNSRFLTKGGRKNFVKIAINDHQDKVFKQWIFKVISSKGRLVYKQSGKNLLPKEIRWEGRNSRRRMVSDGDYWAYIEGVDIEGNKLETNQVSIRVVTRRTTNFIRVK